MDYDTICDKALGALYGVALGDAMGMPSEMFTREKILRVFGHIGSLTEGSEESSISKGFKAGEVTDDTIVTSFVAESIIEADGQVDPKMIIGKIIAWSKSDDKSKCVIGPSTRRAFDQIAQGVPLSETGRYGETNGASMRIVPVGIISSSNMDALVDNVEKACLPTHNTGTAIGAACAVAAAVSFNLDGGTDSGEMVKKAVLASELGSKRGYQVCGPSVAERIRLGIRIVDNACSEEQMLNDLYNLLGTTVASTESVPAAIALAYRCRDDPLKCAEFAANLGGDTDTMGAISCAICGAFSGSGAFPKNIIETIRDVNAIDFSKAAASLAHFRQLNQSF